MIDGTNGTNETPNYGYPEFIATDKPGWLTDWNKTMEAIDENEHNMQVQVNEQGEDLTALHAQVDKHEEDLYGPEGAFQRIADNQNRIQDLEETVGDDSHGLVKDVNDVKADLVETNTMAVKSNGAVNSIRDLICNPFVSTSQYNPGAYVYLQDSDDGEIHYYKCNTLHRGAWNPDHFDDVTEKLIACLDNSGGGGGSQYVLPVAGSSSDVDPVLGGVVIGEGLTIDPETGVVSATGGGGGDVPYATKLVAGKMRPGEGLSDSHDNGQIDVLVDNDTIVIDENGKLAAHKSFTPQDLPIATDNSVGVVKGKTSLNTNEGKINIANDGSLSTAIDDDYIKRKSDGSLTVNPDKIGSASGINVGAGLEKPDSNTISLKRGTPSQLGGWVPSSEDFYKENDKDRVQLKPNGGLIHTNEGLAVDGGGGGGTTYTAGEGIVVDNTNHEISADVIEANGLSVDSTGIQMALASGSNAGATKGMQDGEGENFSYVNNGEIRSKSLAGLVELAKSYAKVMLPVHIKYGTPQIYKEGIYDNGPSATVVNPGDWVWQISPAHPTQASQVSLQYGYQGLPVSLGELTVRCYRCHTQFTLSDLYTGSTLNVNADLSQYLATSPVDNGIEQLADFVARSNNYKSAYMNSRQVKWSSSGSDFYTLPFAQLLIRAVDPQGALQPVATANFNIGQNGAVPVDTIEIPEEARRHPLTLFYPLWFTPKTNSKLDLWGNDVRTFTRCITNITYHVYLCNPDGIEQEDNTPCVEVATKTFSIVPGRWSIRGNGSGENPKGWGRTDDGSVLVSGTHYITAKEPVYVENPYDPDDTAGNYFEYGSCVIYPNNFSTVRVIATIEIIEADDQSGVNFVNRYSTVAKNALDQSTIGGLFALYGQAKLYDLNASSNTVTIVED